MNQVVAQATAHDAHACRVAQVVEQVDGVEQVILFGSRARGDFRPDSDLDLMVVYETTRTSSDVFLPCMEAAKAAAVDEYGHAVSVDITPLAADHFDFMQHGINHVAAYAAREGITPMGDVYRLPSEPGEPSLPEHRRRESMERASHAVGRLDGLEGVVLLGPDHYRRPEQWDIDVGSYAQRALEHALKAVIAAHGARYNHIHPLNQLLEDAQQFVPDLSLRSNLAVLSDFAGGKVYGTPALEVPVDELLESVRQDVTDLLSICARKADFDPWTVGRDDFQRGA
ncbi:MAG: nucleotidyltransferase domain-containing protein [Caldilineaceae bacterium]|nr:nucleotidyltransferase domain-containing protein [Caldilineaceae bacterium]